MLLRARSGQIDERVDAAMAHKIRVARLSAGLPDDESVAAAVGAILEAEAQHAVYQLHEMYLQVHTNNG